MDFSFLTYCYEPLTSLHPTIHEDQTRYENSLAKFPRTQSTIETLPCNSTSCCFLNTELLKNFLTRGRILPANTYVMSNFKIPNY